MSGYTISGISATHITDEELWVEGDHSLIIQHMLWERIRDLEKALEEGKRK